MTLLPTSYWPDLSHIQLRVPWSHGHIQLQGKQRPITEKGGNGGQMTVFVTEK